MVGPETPAGEVERLMVEQGVRHIPVVGDGKRLVGLVTRSRLSINASRLASLNVWEISRSLGNLKAREIMIKRRSVQVVDQSRSIERAAALLEEHKIGCLPVLEEGDVVVGMITETDLFRSFQEMLGLPAEGVRVTVRMSDRKGEFTKLTRALAEKDWGVMGIGSFPTRKKPGYYDVVVKIPGVSAQEVQAHLGAIPGQQIVDIREVA
jgi:acetoin utilization protein AcuB